jgi:hypothetical protein
MARSRCARELLVEHVPRDEVLVKVIGVIEYKTGLAGVQNRPFGIDMAIIRFIAFAEGGGQPMPFVRVYFRETQELVFDAHDKAFRFYGGVCRRGIYDNMKTAVEAIFVGKARRYNRRFLQMCSHHLIEPVACTPASGWEKGQVENQVGNLRDQLFRPKPRVKSVAELNAWLADQCIAYAQRTKHPEFRERTIWDVFQDERASLMELRGPFDGFVEKAVIRNAMSVPALPSTAWRISGPS